MSWDLMEVHDRGESGVAETIDFRERRLLGGLFCYINFIASIRDGWLRF